MGVPTAAAVAAFALVVSVTGADLDQALLTGRAADEERARFHAPYVIAIDNATVETIEVVTEFRRAVLLVEQHARIGDYMFSAPQLEAALRPHHNEVTVRATLRFHPQNALPAIPPYELRVGGAGDHLLALGPTERRPLYVEVGKGKKADQALMGATLETSYDSGIIGQGRYPVTVLLDGREVASAAFDFSTVR